MLNNSFIPLATRRTEKMTAPSDLGGDDSGKRVATTTVHFGLVLVSN